MAAKLRILLVDDDAAIQYAFGRLLELAGHEMVIAENGEQALEKLAGSAFDIVISDISIRGLSGFDLLNYVREHELDCEVILVTGFASVQSAIQALRGGACDYLTKPVQKETLLESVYRAQEKLAQTRQRRGALAMMAAGLKQFLGEAQPKAEAPPVMKPAPKAAAGRYQVGPILLDVDRFVIEVNDQRIDATPTEFEILHYLCRNPDRVVTPAELVQFIRGYTVNSEEAREVIRPHMSNLRRKLLMASQQADVIVTIRSIGYMLKTSPGDERQVGGAVQAPSTGSG